MISNDNQPPTDAVTANDRNTEIAESIDHAVDIT